MLGNGDGSIYIPFDNAACGRMFKRRKGIKGKKCLFGLGFSLLHFRSIRVCSVTRDSSICIAHRWYTRIQSQPGQTSRLLHLIQPDLVAIDNFPRLFIQLQRADVVRVLSLADQPVPARVDRKVPHPFHARGEDVLQRQLARARVDRVRRHAARVRVREHVVQPVRDVRARRHVVCAWDQHDLGGRPVVRVVRVVLGQGRDGLDLLEVEAAVPAIVRQREDGHRVADFADEVVIFRLARRGVEDAVARTRGGLDFDGLELGEFFRVGRSVVVVDGEAADDVGSQIGHDDILARVVEEGLMGVRRILSVGDGAGLVHGPRPVSQPLHFASR